ncbi:MAG: DUF3644 domain-containing protein [Eubacteriales bacterium]
MRGIESYQKIYEFLLTQFSHGTSFSIGQLSESAGLKITTTKVYVRNRLRNKFIMVKGDEFIVTDEIEKYTEDEFIRWMSQKEILSATESFCDDLIKNSIQSVLCAIEIHNKPQISYRYQVVVILVVNAWELALKAYISKFQPETVIINKDGTTKPFPECMRNVKSNLGKKIYPTIDNVELLYKYRCEYIHFYNDELNVLIFSLIQKSVLFFSKFVSIYFNLNVGNLDDFYILPIGFKKPVSPLDFISNDSFVEQAPGYVKNFLRAIIDKTNSLNESQIDELVFVPYSFNLTNIKRVKNADIIAAIDTQSKIKIQLSENIIISDKADAKEVRVEEQDLYGKIYSLRYAEIVEFCKSNIAGWKRNKEFYEKMRELKKNPALRRVRLLDPDKPTGSKKDFYSREILKELVKMYE